VPAGGGGEQIIGKAARHGWVRVQPAVGDIFERPAVNGESLSGPLLATNEVEHPKNVWKCP
jgi:hypothetical protein